ncbi:hypothetical protein FBU30_009031 [Linnemannia zychae]|nr:hypothetical protein FBU30_009031 [Linnemannia zychae]
MASQWKPPSTPPPEDLNSIPIQLPLIPSTTTTHTSESDHTISASSTVESLANKIATTQTWSHSPQQNNPLLGLDLTETKETKKTTGTNQNYYQQSSTANPTTSPRLQETTMSYTRTLGPDASTMNRNRIIGQQDGVGLTTAARQTTDTHPIGTPRMIVRIDRDHNIGDEATRFECEQFPEEFLGRITRAEFKGSVEGINRCMEVAEESLWNCFDTILDCLSAYTAKHCCGTHYQRSIRKMEAFIEEENKRVYHPAQMHLRDPQKVGMIYLEFELY